MEHTQALAASLRPAVFLDRDGVIVEEVGYLAHPDQLVLIPGAADAIGRLNRAGLAVVVVTNQAGVARGLYPESRVEEVHRRLSAMLAEAGAHIDRYYYCPHHPHEGRGEYRMACSCRKPEPGMILRAATELRLDIARSFLVGDKLSDLEAGMRAGCQPMLVLTGYGLEHRERLAGRLADVTRVVRALSDAVDVCLTGLAPRSGRSRARKTA